MQQITVNDAQARLPNLIDEAVNGETVYIVGDSEHIVQLVPVAAVGRPQFGSAAKLMSMADDFDEPLEDFRDYMQ
jgi:antitoxin (DNA-binding transcriptional repressor) of toxin-antitoxin stability system